MRVSEVYISRKDRSSCASRLSRHIPERYPTYVLALKGGAQLCFLSVNLTQSAYASVINDADPFLYLYEGF